MSASVNCTIIGSDNGLSPVRSQTNTWTYVYIWSIWHLATHDSDICIKGLWIGPLSTHFNDICIKGQTFSNKKINLQNPRPICFGIMSLNVWYVFLFFFVLHGSLARYLWVATRNAGNIFPTTEGYRSRQASRHVRDTRAVMQAGIAN